MQSVQCPRPRAAARRRPAPGARTRAARGAGAAVPQHADEKAEVRFACTPSGRAEHHRRVHAQQRDGLRPARRIVQHVAREDLPRLHQRQPTRRAAAMRRAGPRARRAGARATGGVVSVVVARSCQGLDVVVQAAAAASRASRARPGAAARANACNVHVVDLHAGRQHRGRATFFGLVPQRRASPAPTRSRGAAAATGPPAECDRSCAATSAALPANTSVASRTSDAPPRTGGWSGSCGCCSRRRRSGGSAARSTPRRTTAASGSRRAPGRSR